MAWDEAKRQAARERMAHARSVREAKRQAEPLPQVSVDIQPQPDLILTVRRIHVGSFAGLWELCRIEKDGHVTVVSDANDKMTTMNLAKVQIGKLL